MLMDKKAVETWMGTAALASKPYVGTAALAPKSMWSRVWAWDSRPRAEIYVGTAALGCPPGEARCSAYCAAAGTSNGVGVLVAAVFRLATPGASSPRK